LKIFLRKSLNSIYVKYKHWFMNKSQRIYLNTGTTGNNKTIFFKLEQDVELIEFMSMSIFTTDAYQNFNSNYGVLIGRVTANGGIGIPNAKISIFIPLTDTDAQDGDIASIYPYTTPRDTNAEGKRYNLLPRVAVFDPVTGTYSPKQPFGSFPIKPEIVTNQDFLDVYKKYYKYTALTNSAGDYMIFGVPVGLQTVHMSVDITDIGKYSMTPASMVVNLGYSPNLFMDNNSRIKPSTDLNDLPNIETQEISVNIIPFWGDTTNFIIGITRQDFRIRSILDNTFVIFGSAFTDGDNSMWGANPDSNEKNVRELYYINGSDQSEQEYFTGIQSKRIGLITENVYYYPNNITDAQIDSGTPDPVKDMLLLSKSQYSAYKRNGDFVFIISCNRNKVITDDFGNEVPVDEASPNGIFTRFRGFITVEITPVDIPMNFTGSIGTEGGSTTVAPYRFKLKIPQYAGPAQSFTQPVANVDVPATQNWRKQHKIFSGGTLYTISNFHGTVVNTQRDNALQIMFNPANNFSFWDEINSPYSIPPNTPNSLPIPGPANRDWHFQTGIIQTNDVGITGNTQYEMPSNSFDQDGRHFFGGNWMNFTLYLPQLGNLTRGYSSTDYIRTAGKFSRQIPSGSDNRGNSYFLFDNLQPIAAGQYNTVGFARSDLHWTDFVAVPKKDILTLASVPLKGFATGATATLTGKYRNGVYNPPNWIAPCPPNGGKLNGNPLQPDASDPNTYFYKGFSDADCIDFVISLGLI
jgi:hypothetical protein